MKKIIALALLVGIFAVSCGTVQNTSQDKQIEKQEQQMRDRVYEYMYTNKFLFPEPEFD